MSSPTLLRTHAGVDAESSLSQARIDLAAALRWAARLGLSEGVDNHFSMAVPGDDGEIPVSYTHLRAHET